MQRSSPPARPLAFEPLEPRRVLSLTFGVEDVSDPLEHHRPTHPGGPGGPGGDDEPKGVQIDFFTVALHEFGHSLGLGHSNGNDAVVSVMDPVYNGPVAGLAAEDIDRIRILYGVEAGSSQPGEEAWPNAANLTYSYMADGVATEQPGKKGQSNLFETLDKAFGDTATWQGIVNDALQEWVAAIGNAAILSISEAENDSGLPTGHPSATDGDFRIGGHKFDGPGGTLAHAWLTSAPGTEAGDAHFASEENWASVPLSATSSSSSGGQGRPGNLMLLLDDISLSNAADAELIPLAAQFFRSGPSNSELSLPSTTESDATSRDDETTVGTTAPTHAPLVSDFESARDRRSSMAHDDDRSFDVEESDAVDLLLAHWPLGLTADIELTL